MDPPLRADAATTFIIATLFTPWPPSLQGEEKKKLLCGMLMTAADVSAIAKPWELQHETAKMVADEFFDQGDMEKMQLNITPMVRERKRKSFIFELCTGNDGPREEG